MPVRAWVEALVERAVVEVTAVGGGFTESTWVLRLGDGRRLVVRWSDPQVWGAVGREHVRREALACRLLAGSALPVPRLVANDLGGATAGGPANLLTWRPGRGRLGGVGGAPVPAPARPGGSVPRPPGPGASTIAARAGLAVSVHRHPVQMEHRPPIFSF